MGYKLTVRKYTSGPINAIFFDRSTAHFGAAPPTTARTTASPGSAWMANPAVRNNIRAGKVDAICQTLQTSSSEGMLTMDQSLRQARREGKIDYEAAKPYIYEKSTRDTIKAPRR